MNLGVRAVVAVTLMVLFFALALATSAGLLYGAYELAIWTVGHARGRGLVVLLCIAAGMGVGALVVLWSLIPRIDRFEPPGPELEPGQQPELFKEIARVAARTEQAPPRHVYLVHDVNAFVTQRGGWMGFGSQRVMGIGLGLLNLVNVSELRAILAHELGHFHGGDTRLGPWIYKTRGAVVRTCQNLVDAGDATAEHVGAIAVVLKLISKPFIGFATLFLRITQAISRAQELAADRLAVMTFGTEPMVHGLKKTHSGAQAFDVYLRSEVAPLLEKKHLPPVGEGFRRFLGAGDMAETLRKVEAAELNEGQQDPFDSHPPLRERVRHCESITGAPRVTLDDRPAIELLRKVPDLEAEIAAGWTDGVTLTPIEWEGSASVYLPTWNKALAALRKAIPGMQPGTLPRDEAALRALLAKIAEGNEDAPPEAVREWAENVYLGAASGLLVEVGFSATSLPGVPVKFTRGEQQIELFPLVQRHLKGELAPGEWEARWAELGL
jgi:heat shock protein HtpX